MGEILSQIIQTIQQRKKQVLAVAVHLNDTYLIDERPERSLPGFAKVIATVKHLRARVADIMGEDRTLVVHSGDFLGPSRVGKESKGAVIIELLNRLGLDWCVLGNHEFDYNEKVLATCLQKARFGITIANVTAPAEFDVQRSVLWPSQHHPLVALTGVVSETVHSAFPPTWHYEDPEAALLKFHEETEAVAAFRLVLSHATRSEDRRLRKGLQGRLHFLGGHDHDIDWVEDDTSVPIMKNSANLETVRVLILYAGGATAYFLLRSALLKLENSRLGDLPLDEQVRAFDDDPPLLVRYPDDCDRLLSQIPAADARAFKEFWTGLKADDLEPPYSMISAIRRLPNYGNFGTFLLRAQDHELASPEDDEFVAKYIASGTAEDVLVKDFSKDGITELDVSDASMRSGATPFGRFVAECVRKEAGSDLAILNAGSFRADAVFTPILKWRDLADCFLYDSHECIVVLDLPRNAVTALVEHGASHRGEGRFAQVAPQEVPKKETMRLAIVSYLLENERSIDEYAEVLSRHLERGVASMREFVKEKAVKRFAIMQAVQRWASETGANHELDAVGAVAEPVEYFLSLARKMFTAKHDLNELDIQLGNDDPIENTEIQSLRDELRTWLRHIPEVGQADLLVLGVFGGFVHRHLTHTEQNIIRTSRNWLTKVYSALEEHRAKYEDSHRYHKLFERIATGIGGWSGP